MKPILFNTENVRAILEGRKTVTRRVVRFKEGQNPSWTGYIPDGAVLYGSNNIPAAKAPYHPGDILWVRETWQAVYETEWSNAEPYKGQNILELIPNFDSIQKVEAGLSQECSSMAMRPRMKYFVFKASDIEYADNENGLVWRPSIHMPREAARIFLMVNSLRVERLRDMTLGDVIMEGIKEADEYEKTWDRWHQTWNSTIKPEDLPSFGWEANPWVWVIGFERISREEANHGKDSV